jgi:hypothetical protein
MASTPTILITFLGVFLMLSVGAGFSLGTVGNVPDTTATVNAITGPFPTISTATCSFSSLGPTGNCSIVDTWGLGIIWIFASIGSALYRVGAVLFLFVQLIQIMGALTTLPFVGPVFGIFVVLLALYAWSHFRGNHPNL